MLHFVCLGVDLEEDYLPPVNYYNMLAYNNVAVTGRVVDSTGHPIEGAVIRGWNADWSIGMNTFSDSTGRFRLVSNDTCSHFEISAPHYSKVKFNKHLSYPADITLPNRQREYQQIPLLGYGPCIPAPAGPNGEPEADPSCSALPWAAVGDSLAHARYRASQAVEVSIGDIVLKKLL